MKAWSVTHAASTPLSIAELRDGAEFELRNDHPFFEGHFPGNPLLPGVIQLCWFCELVADDGEVKELRNAKFRAEVRGGDRLRFEHRGFSPGVFQIRLFSGEKLCSEAQVRI